METITWKVQFHCDDCAKKFVMFIEAFSGVERATPELSDPKGVEVEGTMEVVYDPSQVDPQKIKKEAQDEGFVFL